MKIVQTIPAGQKDVIKKALAHLEDALLDVNDSETTNFLLHDILTLKSLLKYKVVVVLTTKEMDNFTANNGVDFPIYSEE